MAYRNLEAKLMPKKKNSTWLGLLSKIAFNFPLPPLFMNPEKLFHSKRKHYKFHSHPRWGHESSGRMPA
jgi:hypothetical protein